MNSYNKFMLKLWLIASIVLPIVITYLVIKDGFDKWGAYYVLAGFTFIIYLLRRFMMKRMEKHLQFLNEKNEAEKNN